MNNILKNLSPSDPHYPLYHQTFNLMKETTNKIDKLLPSSPIHATFGGNGGGGNVAIGSDVTWRTEEFLSPNECTPSSYRQMGGSYGESSGSEENGTSEENHQSERGRDDECYGNFNFSWFMPTWPPSGRGVVVLVVVCLGVGTFVYCWNTRRRGLT
eukprot:TRINITY_DN9520_c0_g1_i1.p1 TRINITY_DN9520_c0_g1~~TRINITY_DN9520_c0_g1_i1.p1  ORF type:complete len:157 (-),score=44.04 TRINITY_DN9520_c0_g1_i1:287-757(-)